MRGWFVRGYSGKQSADKGRFFFTKSKTSAGNGEAGRCRQRCAGRIVNRFGRYHTIRQPDTMAVLAFPCFQDRLPLRRDAVSVGGKRALSPKFCIRQTIQAGLPRGDGIRWNRRFCGNPNGCGIWLPFWPMDNKPVMP